MRIIQTGDLTQENMDEILPTETEKLFVYNGLDVCLTSEILDVLLPQLDNNTSATYTFSRELQGPAMDMSLRGILVDNQRKASVISDFLEQMEALESSLERIAVEGLGIFGFKWRSNKDIHELFYRRLGIPVIRKKGVPTVNREALEKMDAYLIARPIIAHLILLRELGKKIGLLRTEVDSDGRMRTGFNIAGTSTGRFSSSYNEYGEGTNLQNIEETLRGVFIADPGMKLAYLDAPQGESRVVGAICWNLFHDGRYLDACESGDLHTNVTKLCWPNLPWTGDPVGDRKLAEQPYYRHYDYRFMCKKIGHGTNYRGKPYTLSQQAKIIKSAIEDFQPKYFTAFPSIPQWHSWIDKELNETGYLISLTGRKRWFFGRRDSEEVRREATAFDPQGSLADLVNRAMLNLWRENFCQLLLQIHDAILIQYPEGQEDEILPRARKVFTMRYGLEHGRELVLTPDISSGWNWGKYSKDNPDGLKSYVGQDKRRRTPQVHLLDRVLR